MAVFAHALGDASAEILPLDAPFLVSCTPQDYARMVSVASDHASEKVDVLLVYAGKAVFLNNEDAEAVAGVECLRSHRIVA